MNIRGNFVFLLAALAWFARVTPANAQAAAVGAGQTLTFRVAGSSLIDASGANAGNIEALSVDPQSGQIRFAMVSLGFPANRTSVTPIPWQLIQYRSDARTAGGIPGTFQQLTVPVSQQVLQSAPRIDSQAIARTTDASWMATSYNYFAPIAAAGGTGIASGVQTGTQNSSANPNLSGTLPAATNVFLTTNSFARTNVTAPLTNPILPQQLTNASLPATFPPPGTLPADALPPGTVPAEALPPGTVPNEGAAPPANQVVPRKVPLVPAAPAAPAK